MWCCKEIVWLITNSQVAEQIHQFFATLHRRKFQADVWQHQNGGPEPRIMNSNEAKPQVRNTVQQTGQVILASYFLTAER